MTDEVTQEVAVNPAPEQTTTAAPDPEVKLPGTDEQKEQPAAKTFTQEELDAAIGKRLAREQRKWEREQAQRLAEMQAVRQPQTAPQQEQFESPEAYAEALAVQKAQELVRQQRMQEERTQVLESYHEREQQAFDKYDDFEQVAYNPRVPITQVMAETIQASELGPDVAYYLGSNPKEADRIARLIPILQAKEIGKIEAKLSSEPPKQKTSSAPPPIQPVAARSTGSPAYDTTDPRSTKTMSTSEWIAAERARQMKKWEAQRNR